MMIRSTLALLGAALLISGCSLIRAAEEPTDLYQVSPKSTFEPNMPAVQWQLAVEVPAAAANLNTGRIAISQSPTSSDYYAKTAWTDRAPAMSTGAPDRDSKSRFRTPCASARCRATKPPSVPVAPVTTTVPAPKSGVPLEVVRASRGTRSTPSRTIACGTG